MHRNRITRRLSYANVIASLALFVALGGASYAAVALPANSVGTKHLKKGAVAGSKIKKNAISSAKVKDGSLQRGDFASGTLLQGAQGAQGLQGQKGDPGQNGAPGPVTGDLPTGATVRGDFNVDFVATTTNERQGGSISFGLRLPTKPTVVVLSPEAQPTAACPGSHTNPQAAPGTLCIYESTHLGNAVPLYVCDTECAQGPTADRYGAVLFVRATVAGRAFIQGSWAATAA